MNETATAMETHAAPAPESAPESAPAPEALGIRVRGEALTELPKDLYIPPEALQVFLEAFEGPLDLLLYLIKKQNIDILDLPIVEITRQYMSYIDVMQELQLELAAEYLVMAATLAEIKSRLLLPRSSEGEEEAETGNDPRAELVRRLQEYERFKNAAEEINHMPRLERDLFVANAMVPPFQATIPLPDVHLDDLFKAFKEVSKRARLYANHQVGAESLSIRERMSLVLERVNTETYTEFSALFDVQEGRMGVVVTFIAILELTRQSLLEITQAGEFSTVYVKKRQSDVYIQEDEIDE